MPIIEDDVKTAMEVFLKGNGYSSVRARLGTRQGHDVEGVNPRTGILLTVECKGEAQTGNQHSRSWPNVASAILTALNETEDTNSSNDVAIAFPDTKEYRNRMKRLKSFCQRQNIVVYWVSVNSSVQQW